MLHGGDYGLKSAWTEETALFSRMANHSPPFAAKP